MFEKDVLTVNNFLNKARNVICLKCGELDLSLGEKGH
jgi:hypothetical protein